MANNIISFFRNMLPRQTPTASVSPWSTVSPAAPNYRNGASGAGSINSTPRGFLKRQNPSPIAPRITSALPTARAGGLTSTNTSAVTDAGLGYSMPNLEDEAWAIVNAAVAKQKAANQAAREAAMLEYEKMKREYDLASQASQASISGQAADDRAKLNNMMASRGIGAGEAAAMNFGRFDQATQDRLAQAIAQYQAQTLSARETADQRVNSLLEQDRLLDTGAPAEAFSVLQELQDSELNRARTLAELNQAGQSALSAYTGSNGFPTDDGWATLTATVNEGKASGQYPSDVINTIYAGTGVNLVKLAQQGHPQARTLIQMLYPQTFERINSGYVPYAISGRQMPAPQEPDDASIPWWAHDWDGPTRRTSVPSGRVTGPHRR